MNDKLKSLRESAEYAEEKLVASVQSLLEEALRERGWNKSDLARKMGVSKARVSQMFSDNQNFTMRLLANAFHALGEELHLGRGSQRVEYKGIMTERVCDQVSLEDRMQEVSHGFEWLDHQIEIGGQPISGHNVIREQAALAMWEALDSALESMGTKSSRQSRHRDQEKTTISDWSNQDHGSNVIPMVRKRAAANG